MTAVRTAPPVPVRRGLLLLAVLLVAVNLRAPITSVSPVLPRVRAELGLDAATASLLTTLPVLCFAAVSALVAGPARRVGLRLAVLLALGGILVGTLLRPLAGPAALLAGTVLVGLAITVGNVLVPVVVKRDFAHRAGPATSAYTAALVGGAALAAGLTAPMESVVGWRAAIATWAVLPAVAAVAWWAGVRPERDVAPAVTAPAGPGLLRSPVAWAIALLLGAQSALYFAVTAWLPTLLLEHAGLAAEPAGAAMSLFQVAGVGGTLVLPALVPRSRRQGWIAGWVGAFWATLAAGMLLAPALWPLWAVVGGLAQGSGLALAFTLIVLRSADETVARQLSGMVQSVGYGVGAGGPLAVGALRESTGTWTVPLLLLFAAAVGLAVAGLVAGRDVVLGAEGASSR